MPRAKKTEKAPILTTEEKAAMYFELDSAEKKAKKAKEPIGASLKKEFDQKGTYEVGEYAIVRGIQERTKMDEDKLIAKLKELGFEQAIKTKEVVDEDLVEELIFQEKIPADLLESCVDVTYVHTLSIKKQ